MSGSDYPSNHHHHHHPASLRDISLICLPFLYGPFLAFLMLLIKHGFLSVTGFKDLWLPPVSNLLFWLSTEPAGSILNSFSLQLNIQRIFIIWIWQPFSRDFSSRFFFDKWWAEKIFSLIWINLLKFYNCLTFPSVILASLSGTSLVWVFQLFSRPKNGEKEKISEENCFLPKMPCSFTPMNYLNSENSYIINSCSRHNKSRFHGIEF